jgi:hypothetical protein
MTQTDAEILSSAYSYAVAECAKGVGVRYVPLRADHEPLYDASNYFGVWLERYATQFGFVTPMTPADMAANQIQGAPAVDAAQDDDGQMNDLTAADRSALQPCFESDEAARFDPVKLAGSEPWNGPLGQIGAEFYGYPEVKQVVDDYDSCLRGLNLEPNPEAPGSVRGADSREISPEQIELALQVVQCKDKVDYVQRLADIMAEKQAPIIEEYATDMVSSKEAIDNVVALAETFIAEHRAEFSQ